jgi:hypothetical protein
MSSQSFMNMDSISKAILAIDISDRPDFMSPKPKSPKKVTSPHQARASPHQARASPVLGKRKYKDAFDEATFEDARYEQHIAVDFFETNMGHAVIQQATDKMIQDFRRDIQTALPILRRERDGEGKYDQAEILAWCEYYLANKNLFNV